MSVIWPPSFAPSVSLKNTRIGYQSWAFDRPASAVTVSGETADGPKDSPLRPDTAEFWEPDELPATWQLDFGQERALDYIGIAAHTLGSSGCTVRVENSYLPFPSFSLPLADRGGSPQGEVDLSLLRGTGGATFTRATIATTVGPTGLVVHVGAGVPRSYYDPTTLEYMGYLAEGSRTNQLINSITPTVAGGGWSTDGLATLTASAVDGPMPGATFSLLAKANGGVYTYQSGISMSNGQQYTYSFFCKLGTASDPNVRFTMYQPGGYAVAFASVAINLSSGAISGITGSARVKSYPNGIYRIECTGTSGASGSDGFVDVTLLGSISDGTGHYIGCAQVEAGGFASSYIPTTSASVQRNADVLTYPLSGNISGAAGACYAEFTTYVPSSTAVPLVLLASPAGQGAPMYVDDSPVQLTLSDGTERNFIAVSLPTTAIQKAATAWGGVTSSGALNGTLGTSRAFDGDLSLTSSLGVGVTADGLLHLFGTIKNVHLWTSQLTDAQLQLITTAGEQVGSPPETYEFDPPWEIFSEEVTPADDAPLLFLDSSRSAQYIRVTITGGADIPRVGVIFAGEVLEMERAIRGGGHAPPNLMRETVLHRSLSRGGQFLGQGFRRNGLTASESFQHLDPTWYRENFDPFVEHARSKPFFFAWRPEEYPDEVAYCWCPDDIHPTYMGIRDLMQVSVNLRGFTE